MSQPDADPFTRIRLHVLLTAYAMRILDERWKRNFDETVSHAVDYYRKHSHRVRQLLLIEEPIHVAADICGLAPSELAALPRDCWLEYRETYRSVSASARLPGVLDHIPALATDGTWGLSRFLASSGVFPGRPQGAEDSGEASEQVLAPGR